MEEGKQLIQGVRCSHVYLLSTLEDLVKSSLLLPQISFKKQANNKLWRLFYHSFPKRLSWCLTGYSRELMSIRLKSTVFCVFQFPQQERKNRNIMQKKYMVFFRSETGIFESAICILFKRFKIKCCHVTLWRKHLNQLFNMTGDLVCLKLVLKPMHHNSFLQTAIFILRGKKLLGSRLF